LHTCILYFYIKSTHTNMQLWDISMRLQRELHNKNLKVVIASVPARPNWLQQGCIWSYASHSQSIRTSPEQHWLAAITTHWLHQLPTVGVDKDILLCQKCMLNNYNEIHILTFCHISRSNGKTWLWCQLALKKNSYYKSSFKLQQPRVVSFISN
jgi:hypothetical protein